MQKVVGSNPISRSPQTPAAAGAFSSPGFPPAQPHVQPWLPENGDRDRKPACVASPAELCRPARLTTGRRGRERAGVELPSTSANATHGGAGHSGRREARSRPPRRAARGGACVPGRARPGAPVAAVTMDRRRPRPPRPSGRVPRRRGTRRPPARTASRGSRRSTRPLRSSTNASTCPWSSRKGLRRAPSCPTTPVTPRQPRRWAQLALATGPGEVVTIQYGRAGFDGCELPNLRRTELTPGSYASHTSGPLQMGEEGEGRHSTVVWPTETRSQTQATYAISGPYGRGQVLRWARSMARQGADASSRRHSQTGC